MYGIVYCTTNLVNGKKYIGQHRCKSKEFDGYLGSGATLSKAIDKYGKENFIRETVCESKDEDDLNELEKYYIEYYGADKSDLFYNTTEGGSGCVSSHFLISVRIYDLFGNFIKEFDSVTECALYLDTTPSRVSHIINGKGLRLNNYVIKRSNESVSKYIHPKWKRVAVYDLKGNFLFDEYNVRRLAKKLNIHCGGIFACLKGLQKKSGKYQFREVINGNIKNKISSYKYNSGQVLKKSIKVYKDGIFVGTYKGIREAGRILKINSSSITSVLKGRIFQTKGYTFEYEQISNSGLCVSSDVNVSVTGINSQSNTTVSGS